MKKVISVINQKGGVGKTATACNLARCFANAELNTLLIDLDPSANATRIFCPEPLLFDVKDFLLDYGCSYPGYHQFEDNLSIIPSHISLALAERELANKPFRETILSKKINELVGFMEYVIIDCPPTLSTLTINAMFASDFILIPITYSKDSLEGVSDLFSLLSEIKEGHTYQIRILRNGNDGRKKTANDFVAEKLAPFIKQGIVLDTVIRQDEEINKASIENLTVIDYAPKSNGAQDYQTLTNELMEIFNHG